MKLFEQLCWKAVSCLLREGNPWGTLPPGHTLPRAGSGMKAGVQDLKLWKEAGLKAELTGAWPGTGGPRLGHTTFTSSKGNRSWKMRLIRAPPESSSVSTWSPEPSILFSKSTPNCWTILQGKRKPKHQAEVSTKLRCYVLSQAMVQFPLFIFSSKIYV